MKIFVHIGLQKTASTAIQRTLAENEEQLGRQGFIYFPRNFVKGRVYKANHDIAWAIMTSIGRGQKFSAEQAERLLLKSSKSLGGYDANVVISTEYLAPAPIEAIEKLKSVLGDRPTEIVLYVRNQIDFVSALINQSVKANQREIARQVPTFLKRADYLAICREWGSVFGDAAIHVRRYDGKPDVVADFFEALGVPEGARPKTSDERANPSLASPALEMKQIVNLFRHSNDMRRVLTEVQAVAGWRQRPHLLEPEWDAEIRRIAAATNAELWARYVRDGSAPFELPEASAGSGPQLVDRPLATIVAGLWLDQQAQIEALEKRVAMLSKPAWKPSWWERLFRRSRGR